MKTQIYISFDVRKFWLYVVDQPNSKEGTGDQSRPTMKKCSDSADNRDAIQSDDHQSCNDLDFKPGKASPPALETEFNDNYSM